MNWLAMLLAYAGAIITGIGKHAGDDINTDDYGMNQTDRDLIAYLKKQVKKGNMSEEEAIEYLRKKESPVGCTAFHNFSGSWAPFFLRYSMASSSDILPFLTCFFK